MRVIGSNAVGAAMMPCNEAVSLRICAPESRKQKREEHYGAHGSSDEVGLIRSTSPDRVHEPGAVYESDRRGLEDYD
jgi:hypothetical protein